MTVLLTSDGHIIDFADHVRALVVLPETSVGKLVHMTMGVAGEAGEIVDVVKKHWIYGKPLDVENVIEEIGDCLFYLQGILNEAAPDVSLEEVMQRNVTKLEKRYPQGFTQQAALDRVDKQENT